WDVLPAGQVGRVDQHTTDRVGWAGRPDPDPVDRAAVAEPKDLVGRPLDDSPRCAQRVRPVTRGGDDPPVGTGDRYPDLGPTQVDSRNHLMKGSRSAGRASETAPDEAHRRRVGVPSSTRISGRSIWGARPPGTNLVKARFALRP